jgi:nucleoid DNA-binding protein
MATRVDVINALRPRVVLKPEAGTEQLADFIAERTAIESEVVKRVLAELHHAVIHFAHQGAPVAIEGLGVYSPTIDLSGEFDCSHRTDRRIVLGLNQPGGFNGEIANRENIGKATRELVALWNETNPDDRVE